MAPKHTKLLHRRKKEDSFRNAMQFDLLHSFLKMAHIMGEIQASITRSQYFESLKKALHFYFENNKTLGRYSIFHLIFEYGIPGDFFRRRFMNTELVVLVIRFVCTVRGARGFAESVVRAADFRPNTFLEYVLYHITASKLTFEGKRFTELVEETIEFWKLVAHPHYSKDKSVLTLLQYGAWLYAEDEDSDRVTYHCKEIISKSVAYLRKVGLFHNGRLCEDVSVTARLKCYLYRTRLFLTNLPNPHTATLRVCEQLQIPSVEVMRPVYNRYFAGMELGSATPSSLLHSCRGKIRRILYENWQLPSGISLLHIPKEMEEYLNLTDDRYR